MPCNSIPSLDLELWKERLSCTVGHTTIHVGSAERISPCVMCTCTTEGVSTHLGSTWIVQMGIMGFLWYFIGTKEQCKAPFAVGK